MRRGGEREREPQYGAHSFPLSVYKFTRGRKRILVNELGEIMTGINFNERLSSSSFPSVRNHQDP